MLGFASLWLARLGPLLFLAALTGCVQYRVAVSALAAPGADLARRYVLIPADENTSPEDLQFQEYAQYLHRAMALQGFKQAPDSRDADIFVLMAYTIGDPQEHVQAYSVPQWGQTGVASRTTYGTANTFGSANVYGNSGSYSGTTNYSITTYYQPTYGITGYSTRITKSTTYTRLLNLFAFDAAQTRSGRDPDELWRVSVVSTGRSGDLRSVFPVLVAAAHPYLGKATGGRAVTLTLSENDSRVRQIRDDTLK